MSTVLHIAFTLHIAAADWDMLATILPEAQALTLSSAEDFQMSCSTPGMELEIPPGRARSLPYLDR